QAGVGAPQVEPVAARREALRAGEARPDRAPARPAGQRLDRLEGLHRLAGARLAEGARAGVHGAGGLSVGVVEGEGEVGVGGVAADAGAVHLPPSSASVRTPCSGRSGSPASWAIWCGCSSRTPPGGRGGVGSPYRCRCLTCTPATPATARATATMALTAIGWP